MSLRLRMRDHAQKAPGSNVIECDREPCCAVVAIGLGGRTSPVYIGEHKLVDDGAPAPALGAGKEPYRVPLVAEVRELPWNGLNVASIFCGGGGSSTGYRMAGYRVLAACEFAPEAQDTYTADAAPYTTLLRKDMRELTAAELLDAIGLERGQLDVLDGSPPCEPFSTAGLRDRKWGQEVSYSGQVQRTDDLFFEYARLIEGVQPRAFVAEIVAGLVAGRAKGYFRQIHARLRECGYRVEARAARRSVAGRAADP
jgi:DNA (cytosine-5)-methyltransferase 1